MFETLTEILLQSIFHNSKGIFIDKILRIMSEKLQIYNK